MKTFLIVGGQHSPNAVIVAPSEAFALATYNNWLELTEGRRDDGVGISELTVCQTCVVTGGFHVYDPGVAIPVKDIFPHCYDPSTAR